MAAAAMAGHGDGLAGLVARVDDALPVRELPAESAVRVGLGAVVVAGDSGEQPRAARGPVPEHVLLLGAQPGLDQDYDEVAGGGEREPVQRGGGLELGHHELGDEAGYLVVVVGELFGVDDGAVGQSRQPAVAVAGAGEHPEHAQRQRPGGRRVALGQEPGQVILQDRPGEPASPAMPGWRSARNAENRDRASAPAEMVVNAHPVASRNRDRRFTGSRSQSWVMASNRAACRPRRAGPATPPS
jgi:hypothetical protein